MVNNIKIYIPILTVSICFIYLSCENNFSKKIDTNNKSIMEDKYKWLPTECAPIYYPIEIHEGYFYTEDGTLIGIPSGGRTVHNGWGKVGSTYMVGSEMKSIPEKLVLTWMCFTENKFFTGKFDLPTRKIRLLFEEGYTDRRGVKETYSRIMVGMAPKGVISVWVMGAGLSHEVAHYKAKEVDIVWKEFNPDGIQDRNKYVLGTLNDLPNKTKLYLKENGVINEKWDNLYRQRYKWKPVLEFEDEAHPSQIRIEHYNGEHLWLQPSNPFVTTFQERAVPSYIKLNWRDKNQQEYGTQMYFNEAEMFAIFKKIYQNPQVQQAELILKIDKYNSNLSVSIKSGDISIDINPEEIKVYPLIH